MGLENRSSWHDLCFALFPWLSPIKRLFREKTDQLKFDLLNVSAECGDSQRPTTNPAKVYQEESEFTVIAEGPLRPAVVSC
jgi:hypothetical protein